VFGRVSFLLLACISAAVLGEILSWKVSKLPISESDTVDSLRVRFLAFERSALEEVVNGVPDDFDEAGVSSPLSSDESIIIGSGK
jgi:hypothetical protein